MRRRGEERRGEALSRATSALFCALCIRILQKYTTCEYVHARLLFMYLLMYVYMHLYVYSALPASYPSTHSQFLHFTPAVLPFAYLITPAWCRLCCVYEYNVKKKRRKQKKTKRKRWEKQRAGGRGGYYTPAVLAYTCCHTTACMCKQC